MARSSDDALRDLCARLFREPDRLVQAHRIPVHGNLDLPPHRHADLWQLDVAFGCTGHWQVNGKSIEARGTTAATFYPGDDHGYALRPRGRSAVLYSIKIRAPRSWPALKARILPAHAPGIAGERAVETSLRRLSRLAVAPEGRTALLASALAETFCLWPRRSASGSTSARVELDARIEAAIETLEQRLDDPPTLGELAAGAHLSARHFARRFREICGCSPKAYIAARRLGSAREQLAQGHLTVTAVADALGFASIHTFSRWFRKHAGVSPAQYRDRPTLL